MNSNNRTAGLAAALLLSASAAQATLAAAATFEQKVENAAAIILAKCVRTESRWDSTHRWILTYSTFQVEKTMKGSAAPEVTLVTPGGQVGSIHQATIGIPLFQPGREHVLFVKETRFGPTVLYFDQGAYNVITDSRGEKIVAPVASDLVKIDTQRGVAISPDVPQSLQDFERHVADTVRELREQKIRMDAAATAKVREDSSFWNSWGKNRWIVFVAVIGIAFATWRLLRH